MKYLSGIIGKIVLIVGSFFVCCGGLAWHTINLNLLHRPATDIFTYMFAWGLTWVLTLLCVFVDHRLFRRTAGGVLAVISLWLFLQTLVYYVPAVGTWVGYSNRKLAQTAQLTVQEAPTEVVCNKTTYRHIQFFSKDATTGKRVPKILYSERDGVITCFSGDGYDPLYGNPLKPVIDETIVRRIAEQDSPQPPTPPQIVSAPAAPSPAPPQATPEAPVWGPEQRAVIMSGDPDQ